MSEQKRFQRVALIGKYQASDTQAVRDTLCDIVLLLAALGCTVVLEAETAQATSLQQYAAMDLTRIGSHCDVAVVVGGDGTMLGVGRALAAFDVPLIGINLGRLGFITDISLSHYAQTLPDMLQGQYTEDVRGMLNAQVWRGNVCIFEALALNDVVVNRGKGGLVELSVEVDGNFVANQSSDGLIIATPTGSTAYALSAGGPIMTPAVAAWVMVPIAPHGLSNRPVVLAEPHELVVQVVAGRDVSATFDMIVADDLRIGDRIVVTPSALQARFLHPLSWNYFATLRAKLHWSARGHSKNLGNRPTKGGVA